MLLPRLANSKGYIILYYFINAIYIYCHKYVYKFFIFFYLFSSSNKQDNCKHVVINETSFIGVEVTYVSQ